MSGLIAFVVVYFWGYRGIVVRREGRPPREAIYAASKAAMSSFGEGLSSDLRGSNIHVALIHPGPIATEIWEKEDEPVAYVTCASMSPKCAKQGGGLPV